MKASNWLAIVWFWSFAVAAFGAEPPRDTDVCVRNFYPEGSGMNPCLGERSMFREVISAEDETKSICTKAYEDRLCQTSPKEYRYVETSEQEVICTVNFHQEGIAEYCYSNPKIFSWARGRL